MKRHISLNQYTVLAQSEKQRREDILSCSRDCEKNICVFMPASYANSLMLRWKVVSALVWLSPCIDSVKRYEWGQFTWGHVLAQDRKWGHRAWSLKGGLRVSWMCSIWMEIVLLYASNGSGWDFFLYVMSIQKLSHILFFNFFCKQHINQKHFISLQ